MIIGLFALRTLIKSRSKQESKFVLYEHCVAFFPLKLCLTSVNVPAQRPVCRNRRLCTDNTDGAPHITQWHVPLIMMYHHHHQDHHHNTSSSQHRASKREQKTCKHTNNRQTTATNNRRLCTDNTDGAPHITRWRSLLTNNNHNMMIIITITIQENKEAHASKHVPQENQESDEEDQQIGV